MRPERAVLDSSVVTYTAEQLQGVGRSTSLLPPTDGRWLTADALRSVCSVPIAGHACSGCGRSTTIGQAKMVVCSGLITLNCSALEKFMANKQTREVHLMSLGKFDRHGSFSVDLIKAAETPEFKRMVRQVREGMARTKGVRVRKAFRPTPPKIPT